MLVITEAKGFAIRFKNGWSVSVQWGPGNYCERRREDLMKPILAARTTGVWASHTAEVMVTDPDGTNANPEGWLSADTVAVLIAETCARNPAERLPVPTIPEYE